MGISQVPIPVSRSRTRRADLFTASGTWTCPTGVTYAIANVLGGGGGGGGQVGFGSAGGSSSAALGVTITSNGGAGTNGGGDSQGGVAAQANSGVGGRQSNGSNRPSSPGCDATLVVGGSIVTPGTSYTVTVGSGGAGGSSSYAPGGAGGSGVVWIEYEVES